MNMRPKKASCALMPCIAITYGGFLSRFADIAFIFLHTGAERVSEKEREQEKERCYKVLPDNRLRRFDMNKIVRGGFLARNLLYNPALMAAGHRALLAPVRSVNGSDKAFDTCSKGSRRKLYGLKCRSTTYAAAVCCRCGEKWIVPIVPTGFVRRKVCCDLERSLLYLL